MHGSQPEPTQSWFVLKLAVALGPLLTFLTADVIGWFLRRKLWRRMGVVPRSGRETAHHEPAEVAALSCRRLRLAMLSRAFRRSGTDGSNPVPSSGESATNSLPVAAHER
jgi:hypothetical protein